ncbi:unnamed protein product [Zymoseptoria tritici ST99CH_1A5]|uniref:Phosphoglycerate mutase-like protein n=1 Tax=Zymoseptoria tritici ST99CH_1A5 TaxID=1276529 RepID=A0A1Y6LWP9_ZYMTR|nr:unnamed protein product [Zymoseptoria tritici ST99CH_1A5]
MAPNSRIILTRHAQAEHNVDLDYTIPDAPLTPLGRKQASSLSTQINSTSPGLLSEVDLVVSSPLKRTLQTTYLGYKPTIDRLGGLGKVITLPQAQECNDFPCDTGSSAATLSADPEFQEFNFENLTDDWTSKQGFWAADEKALTERARWVRQWLRKRPEKCIILVAHGDVLRRITANERGPNGHGWKNAEARVFRFKDGEDEEECFLVEEGGDGVVAVAGGYAPGSSEIFVDEGVGKL